MDTSKQNKLSLLWVPVFHLDNDVAEPECPGHLPVAEEAGDGVEPDQGQPDHAVARHGDNKTLESSVADPDPVGSVSFGRIRIRIRKRWCGSG